MLLPLQVKNILRDKYLAESITMVTIDHQKQHRAGCYESKSLKLLEVVEIRLRGKESEVVGYSCFAYKWLQPYNGRS